MDKFCHNSNSWNKRNADSLSCSNDTNPTARLTVSKNHFSVSHAGTKGSQPPAFSQPLDFFLENKSHDTLLFPLFFPKKIIFSLYSLYVAWSKKDKA